MSVRRFQRLIALLVLFVGNAGIVCGPSRSRSATTNGIALSITVSRLNCRRRGAIRKADRIRVLDLACRTAHKEQRSKGSESKSNRSRHGHIKP
jgi:hypothetical protein